MPCGFPLTLQSSQQGRCAEGPPGRAEGLPGRGIGALTLDVFAQNLNRCAAC
jgi:hypothetical protein